jgi:hypothetical protein
MVGILVPKEPICLNFNPKYADPGTESVFEDDVARTLYLMIRPQHLVDITFTMWCLARACEIRAYLGNKKGCQIEIEELHAIIRPRVYGPMDMLVLSQDWRESIPWLERFIEAVSGLRPVEYSCPQITNRVSP